MKIKVGIANYGQFAGFIEKIQPDLPEDVELVVLNDLFSELKESIHRIEQERSVDIFVGSGGNAEFLQQYLTEIPLVKVEVTGFDILNALKDVHFFSDHAAIVVFRSYEVSLKQFDALKEVCGMDVCTSVYSEKDEVDYILQAYRREGIRDVIGSAYVLERARLYDMRGHFLWSLDGVRSAIMHAVTIARYKKEDAEKARKLNSILDNAAEGIIVTDKDGIITDFNAGAERILNHRREDFIGKSCNDTLPNTRLPEVIAQKRAEINKIQDLGTVKVVTNRCPIFCNGETIGALATFQSVSSIKKAEESIRRNQYFKGFVAKTCFADIEGVSTRFLKAKRLAESYAKYDSTIIIFGETGTGKELFAQSIHNASPRKNGPFVAVNCSAFPPDLLESELFGYEEGAFTGARKGGKPGLFEMAHEGTLFLDEIGEISPELQARLLRVIEEKTVFPIGGDRLIPVDIRIIAATNRDLWQMAQDGDFRRDLYYRLNVLKIELPALRDRREDIPLLVRKFILENREDFAAAELHQVSELSILKNYDWPGNIRELKNIMERFCVLHHQGEDSLETFRTIFTPHRRPKEDPRRIEEAGEIVCALGEAGGNRARAAEILGISRTTLWRKMREYSLE